MILYYFFPLFLVPPAAKEGKGDCEFPLCPPWILLLPLCNAGHFVPGGGYGIVAAIDDGLLNINFRVLGFETVFFDNMGNAVPEVSSGASFSTRQKDMFRRLSRGKRFYISRVRAVGPDGVERLLPTTLEVIVN